MNDTHDGQSVDVCTGCHRPALNRGSRTGLCRDCMADAWQRAMEQLMQDALDFAFGVEDQPEVDTWDPGPECDDEGGMSEFRGLDAGGFAEVVDV